jgi:hypothetical protein
VLGQLEKNVADIDLLRTQAFQIKDACKVKRLQQLKHESYLGPMVFDDVLRHSCVECYFDLKKNMEIYTYKVFYMS